MANEVECYVCALPLLPLVKCSAVSPVQESFFFEKGFTESAIHTY